MLVNISRRGLIGSTAATIPISISGCTGQESNSSQNQTKVASSKAERSVRIVPHGVTTVLQGTVERSTIVDKFNLSDSVENIRVYQQDQESSTVTYFVYISSELTVSEVQEAFNKVDGFTVEKIRPGIGPKLTREFKSSIESIASENDAIDASEIDFSETISNDEQHLIFSTNSDVESLVPVLPETEIKRVVEYNRNGQSEAEPLLKSEDYDFGSGFRFVRNEAVGLIFSLHLNETGANTLRTAVKEADKESLTPAFLQLVVDGEAIDSYGISSELASDIQSDSWDRNLRLPVGTDQKSKQVMKHSGMPELPFDFRIDQ